MHKFFLLATAIATQTAMAHQGAHHQDENIAFWHWLTEPDHLAFGAIILIVGVSSVAFARQRARKTIRSEHHDSR